MAKWNRDHRDELIAKRKARWASNKEFRDKSRKYKSRPEVKKRDRDKRREWYKTLLGKQNQVMYGFARSYNLKWDDCRCILKNRVLMDKFEKIWQFWIDNDYIYALAPAFEWTGKGSWSPSRVSEVDVMTVAKRRNIRTDKLGNRYDKSGNLIRQAATIGGDTRTVRCPGQTRSSSNESSEALS